MTGGLRRQLRTTGIVLLVIGVLGILAPKLVSVTLSVLVASMLLLAGLVLAWMTWYGYQRNALAWLKPFILLALGLLILFKPIAGTAAIGMALLIYFLLDGFASISLALAWRPMDGWLATLLSGIASTILGIVFLLGWPYSSAWLVGLFVAISLLFNGIALLLLASAART